MITMKLKETVESGEPPAAPTSGDSEWVISIREKLDQARQEESARPWAEHTIYRVPKSLREVDENAYVPKLVSLGPYHHGRHSDMERHKWRALHNVLRRTGHEIENYLDSIRSLEEKARACYEGNISLASNEFVEMMVLDGTFVLELFRWAAGEEFGEYLDNDPVFAMRGTMHSIQRDMIMLENQIPFFVLNRLHFLQTGVPEQCGSVASLAVRFFDPLIPTFEPLGKGDRRKMESSNRSLKASAAAPFDSLSEGRRQSLHCLDVFRQSLLHTGPQPAHHMTLIERVWSRGLRCLVVCRESLLTLIERGWSRGLRCLVVCRESLLTLTNRGWSRVLHCLVVCRESLLGPQRIEQAGDVSGDVSGDFIPMAAPVQWDYAFPLRFPGEHVPKCVDKRRRQLIRCVSELREAGIKFRKRTTDRFWDIECKHGVLEIPPLLIDDGTKPLFLNLIAFEQCYMDRSNDITAYVIFMDNLINSEKDVGHLRYRGIIEHWMGTDGEVADLFNRLCRGVVVDPKDNYLSGLAGQVNEYCDHRRNGWRASLKHTYFGNPWAIISLFAAVVLLLLTFAQTFYAVYSYYWPSS